METLHGVKPLKGVGWDRMETLHGVKPPRRGLLGVEGTVGGPI